MIVLDAVVATTPRFSARSMRFEIEFAQGDGVHERIQIVSPRHHADLANITRGSRVLIGGNLRSGVRLRIVAGPSAILWLAPNDSQERAAPRVHDVEAHWRLLASGRRIRVRGHVRGHAGLRKAVASRARD